MPPKNKKQKGQKANKVILIKSDKDQDNKISVVNVFIANILTIKSTSPLYINPNRKRSRQDDEV